MKTRSATTSLRYALSIEYLKLYFVVVGGGIIIGFSWHRFSVLFDPIVWSGGFSLESILPHILVGGTLFFIGILAVLSGCTAIVRKSIDEKAQS